MAENKLIIGSLPVLRGAYDSATNYYRDNQVTMYGSTFQSLVDENVGYPPAELREDGKVYAINTDKWIIVANAIDAYNAGERIANAETRIKELGEYADSPEFIRVYTDANRKFLWGIRADGTVEWAKGVPTPVKEALRELESKINTDNNGKFEEIETSLVALQDAVDVINASLKPLTDTFSFQDSPEFVNVVTDADGKVLFGLTAEGKPYFPKNTMYSVESNQEFLAAWLDSAGHVLFGLRTDGSTYVAKADFLTKIEEIMKLLDENSIKDEEIAAQVKQLQDTFSIVSNDEWLHAVIDAEGKVLFGIKAENGEVVMPKQDTYKVVSNDEWMAAWLDSQDRILFGVKADGTFWAAKHNFNTGKDYDNQIEQINTTLATIQDTLASVQETVSGLQHGNEAMQMLSVIDDPEERTEITTDAEDRVLSYRDKDGVKHEEKLAINKVYINDEEVELATADSIELERVIGVNNHNTPNLLIAAEMQKTFNDGTNSFTPPNEGYEMSNPIECQAGDWFTRTGTATGMVVVTDENDKNGTRLFNADGTTLGNTFQVPVSTTWVRYIRIAASKTGAEDGSVVICKGKIAYTGEEEGDFVTVDKLKLTSRNFTKETKYLFSPSGKVFELVVDNSGNLSTREIDPDIIPDFDLPEGLDFSITSPQGTPTFNGWFDRMLIKDPNYIYELNENGVTKYKNTGYTSYYYSNFEHFVSSAGYGRYGVITNSDLYKGFVLFDEKFNVVDNIETMYDVHDFIYIDDMHYIFFSGVQKNVDGKGLISVTKITEYKNGAIIAEYTVDDMDVINDVPLNQDELNNEFHQNTLCWDQNDHSRIILNPRNCCCWLIIKRTEDRGNVTIGPVLEQVGGLHASDNYDKVSRRIKTDELCQWFLCHDVKYWGMKNIGEHDYPTYTLFDNNYRMDINPRNNPTNNPNSVTNTKSTCSRIVQMSIDWDSRTIKEYKVYVIPGLYSSVMSGATMFEEGKFEICYAIPRIVVVCDFTTEETEISGNLYKGAKILWRLNKAADSIYRAEVYKLNV